MTEALYILYKYIKNILLLYIMHIFKTVNMITYKVDKGTASTLDRPISGQRGCPHS
jgi:hypothetical protein